MAPVEELIERCRAVGMRVTAQRRAIFELLQRNQSHPTAEEIFQLAKRRVRGVSLATVYNTLETLIALGEVERRRFNGGGDRFDPEVRPHHHFRCEKCGKVSDAFGKVSIPRLSGLEGCEIDQVEMVLSGRCSECRVGQRKSESPSSRRLKNEKQSK